MRTFLYCVLAVAASFMLGAIWPPLPCIVCAAMLGYGIGGERSRGNTLPDKAEEGERVGDESKGLHKCHLNICQKSTVRFRASERMSRA